MSPAFPLILRSTETETETETGRNGNLSVPDICKFARLIRHRAVSGAFRDQSRREVLLRRNCAAARRSEAHLRFTECLVPAVVSPISCTVRAASQITFFVRHYAGDAVELAGQVRHSGESTALAQQHVEDGLAEASAAWASPCATLGDGADQNRGDAPPTRQTSADHWLPDTAAAIRRHLHSRKE